MKHFIYHAPTEIVFGVGKEDQAGAMVKKYGGSRVFIVYGGASAKKSGLLDRMIASCQAAGLEVMASGGVVPNPLVSTAKKMIEEAIAFKADFILAVGGGSVIDTAKGVAHGTANPGVDIWDIWTKKAPLEKSLPHGTVLTISAAGSETSDSAVLTNDLVENPTKRGINTPFNRCKFALMDPALTSTLPKYQIGAGAADIFMHTSERYFTNLLGNHLTDRIAEALFMDIIEYGPKGVVDPYDMEAMSEIMWAGSISHVGITGVGAKGDTAREGDWACHQLGMAISAVFDSTHGATLTAVWGTWSRYVCHENIARYAEFARNVYGVTEADDEKAAMMGIEKTEEFFASLGMPLNLTDLLGHKPTEDELLAITEECSYGKTRTIGSFKTLNYDDILAIYRQAV